MAANRHDYLAGLMPPAHTLAVLLKSTQIAYPTLAATVAASGGYLLQSLKSNSKRVTLVPTLRHPQNALLFNHIAIRVGASASCVIHTTHRNPYISSFSLILIYIYLFTVYLKQVDAVTHSNDL